MKKLPIKKSLKDRLRKIRMLVLDVDGVMTDCRMFLDSSGEWRRLFSIRDGYGIVKVMQHGMKTAIITGSKAADIQDRARALKIHYFYEGHLEKLSCLKDLAQKSGLKFEQMAYCGDDDFDVPVLESVGFAATVPEAMESALAAADYVTRRPGGHGAVREICELLIQYSERPGKDSL